MVNRVANVLCRYDQGGFQQLDAEDLTMEVDVTQMGFMQTAFASMFSKLGREGMAWLHTRWCATAAHPSVLILHSDISIQTLRPRRPSNSAHFWHQKGLDTLSSYSYNYFCRVAQGIIKHDLLRRKTSTLVQDLWRCSHQASDRSVSACNKRTPGYVQHTNELP